MNCRIGLGQVWRICIGIGVHGDSRQTEVPAGSKHPARDLAAIGNQN